jgi:hypothetical protein
MKHGFIAGTIDRTSCLKCKRDEISHTAYAQCEACPNKGICEIYNDMLLCMGCFTRESIAGLKKKHELPANSVQNAQAIMPQIRESESNAVERLAQKLQNNNIEKSADYFNAKTVQLTDLEAKYMNDESIPADKRYYEFAKHIVNEHARLTPILFEAIDVQVEIMSNQNAMTVYLNGIANKLRLEERAELKVKDIEYQPKTAPNKVKAVKMTPLERLAEQYAKSLGVDIETAKNMVQNLVQENKAKCSCAETPGLCKAHPAS